MTPSSCSCVVALQPCTVFRAQYIWKGCPPRINHGLSRLYKTSQLLHRTKIDLRLQTECEGLRGPRQVCNATLQVCKPPTQMRQQGTTHAAPDTVLSKGYDEASVTGVRHTHGGGDDAPFGTFLIQVCYNHLGTFMTQTACTCQSYALGRTCTHTLPTAGRATNPQTTHNCSMHYIADAMCPTRLKQCSQCGLQFKIHYYCQRLSMCKLSVQLCYT